MFFPIWIDHVLEDETRFICECGSHRTYQQKLCSGVLERLCQNTSTVSSTKTTKTTVYN